MSATVLAVVAAGQILLFVFLLVALVGHRLLDDWRAPGRAAERARFATLLRRTLMGAESTEVFAAALPTFRGEAIATVLHDYAAQIGGDAWERVVAAMRQSNWMEEYLVPLAESRLWWNRLVAARVLAILGDELDMPIAARLIADPHPAVRIAAVPAIRRVPSHELLGTVLTEALRSRHVVRRYLFDTLVEVRQSLTPLIADRLTAEAQDPDLATLISLAGELGVPQLVDGILRYKNHEGLEIRIAVARALAPFPHPTVTAALVDLLQDDAWQVRTQAAASLGAIRAPEALNALHTALGDPNWWVRLRAGIALRHLGATGHQTLERAGRGSDRFAADMAHYVMRLSDAAVGDYAG